MLVNSHVLTGELADFVEFLAEVANSFCPSKRRDKAQLFYKTRELMRSAVEFFRRN